MYTYHPADGGSLWSKHTSYAGSYNFSCLLRSAGLLLFRRYTAVSFGLQDKQRRLCRGSIALHSEWFPAISFVGYIVCGFVMV